MPDALPKRSLLDESDDPICRNLQIRESAQTQK